MDKDMDENKNLISTTKNNKVPDKGTDIKMGFSFDFLTSLDLPDATDREGQLDPAKAVQDELFIPAMPEDRLPSFKSAPLTPPQAGENSFSSRVQEQTILGIGTAVDLPSLPAKNNTPVTQQDERPAFKATQNQQDERPAFKATQSQQDERPAFKATQSQQDERPAFKATQNQQDERPAFKATQNQQDERPAFKATQSQQDERPAFKATQSQQDERPALKKRPPSIVHPFAALKTENDFLPPQSKIHPPAPNQLLPDSAPAAEQTVLPLVPPNEAMRRQTVDFGRFNLLLEDNHLPPAPSPANRAHVPTVDFGAFLSIDDEAASPRGISKATPDPMADRYEQSGLGVPKIKLDGANVHPPLLHRERTVTGKTPHRAYDIDNDSGLPLNDDPLSISAMGSSLGLADSEKTPFPSQAFGSSLTNAAFGASERSPQTSVFAHSDELKPSDLDLPLGQVVELPNATVRPSEEVEMVFNLDSIRAQSPVAVPLTSPASASHQSPKKSSLKRRQTIGGIAAGCVFVAAIAFAVHNYYAQHVVPPANPAPQTSKLEVSELNWTRIKRDSLNDYTQFLRSARENLRQTSLSPQERLDTQGQFLTTLVLASTRYQTQFESEFDAADNLAKEIGQNADCSGGWCAAGLWAWHLFRNNTGKDEPSAENKLSAEEDPSAEGESSVKLASEDAEFSDLRRVIRAAVTYAHWKPYRQNNKDFTHTAQAILDELQEDSQWPIASWLKARAHFVIGNFDQASALLEPYVSPQPPFVYPPAQILYAQTQFELGMFQKAFDLSETILNAKQAEPDDIERAHITRMYAQAYLANWDLTQPILNDFITANKDNAQTLDVAVSLCSQFGHTDTCQVAFQRILETEPQNPAVLYALSNILISIITVDNLINAQIRKHQPAFDYLKNIVDQAIELTPGNIRLWVYRSLILIAQNDLTGAKAALLEAERDERHAGALRLNEILTAKISNDKTRQDTTPALYAAWANDVHLLPDAYLLSNLLRAHQMYDEASLVIERMRVRYPQNLSLLGERFRIAIAQHDLAKAEDSFERFRSARALTHDHQFQMAILAVSLGDADDALKRMSTLVAQAPNHDDYLFSLGMLYFNRQDFGSAKVYFDRALQIDITNAKYHFYKGRSLYEEKAFNEALLAFNEASRHDESNKEYVFWIGLTLAGLNHYEEALRAFTTVIDTFNARPDADRTDRDRADAAEAHFYRANLNQQRQRRFHAEEDFVAANRLAPLNPRYVQGYATFLFESGKLNAALAEIAKIEAIHGTNLDAGLFFAKGLALLKINKPKEALTAFEIARDKGFAERASTGIIGFKDPAEVYERLGYLYRDFGRKADARQALEKYLNTSQHLSATDKREITLQLERL